MFHVNQFKARLLADAELGEDGAQNLLDVDRAGEAAQVAGGDAELLGLELRREIMVNETLQSVPR